jgi:hypothetical protein
MSKTLIFKPNKLIMLPFVIVAIVIAILIPLWTITTTSMIMLVVWVLAFVYHYRRFNSEYYLVSDNSIQVVTAKNDSTISLVNITDIISRQYTWLPLTNLGEIEIHANGQKHYLKGLKDATGTAGIIKMAVDAAVARSKQSNRPAYYQPELHAAGTLELMNDLVGLWQQGILTDEEFQRETDKLKTNSTSEL